MTKQELAAKIWNIANELRGRIKSSEYKDYIISFMFYKFLSDKEEETVLKLGGTKEDIKDLDNKEQIQGEIGYFIEYDNLFSQWLANTNKLNAGIVSEALIAFNRDISSSYRKVFENIFAVIQQGLSKLGDTSGSRDRAVRDIVELVKDIPTTSDKYDVGGFILEFWLKRVAQIEDGSYFTPHEVSKLKAKIIAHYLKDRESVSVYDPTSGSGGLLLTIGEEVGKYVDKNNIKYYAQELINETYNICRMNLVMKGIPAKNICTRNADTLAEDWPYFDEQTAYEPMFVDACSSNPPYSLKWNSDFCESDPRFKYGLAPSGKADYAFLLHCLYHLKSDGIMTIVLPHGVLFRGDAEGAIRKNLIENNHIEAIIGLPQNLFFSTGIPTLIMVCRKTRENSDVLFIDASKNFKKDKTQNVLRESDVKRIFDAVVNRTDVPKFARLVSKDEIVANDYNLNIPRYISAAESAEEYDLYSEMTGEINKSELAQFDDYWSAFPALLGTLYNQSPEPDYYQLRQGDINDIISNDKDIQTYKDRFAAKTAKYRDYLIHKLVANAASTNNETLDIITDQLFKLFDDIHLIDNYDLYQILADKWYEIENDLSLIRENGLSACKQTEPNIVVKKDAKSKRTYEEQNGFKGVIFPFDLIQKQFFDADFEEIRRLNAQADSCVSEYNDILDGLEEDVKTSLNKNRDIEDADFKLDTAAMNKMLKDKSTSNTVFDALMSVKRLMEEEKAHKKAAKDINDALEGKTKTRIETLTEDEIIELLIMKWINPVVEGLQKVCDNTFNTFSNKLEALNKKYSDTLASINAEINVCNEELFALMDQLVGSETDMKAIYMLKEALK